MEKYSKTSKLCLATKILLIFFIASIISCNQKKENQPNQSKTSGYDTIVQNDTLFIRMPLNYERYELRKKGSLLGDAFKKNDAGKILPKILENYPLDEKNLESKINYGSVLFDYRCMACHNSSKELNVKKWNSMIQKDAPKEILINKNKFQFKSKDSYHWFATYFSSTEAESIKLYMNSK